MTDRTKPVRSPRVREVALRAGVSTSTVSVVLSGKAIARGIPESTVQRVLDAASELGYRPNVIASGLRRQTSDTIGFVSDVIATTPHAGAMVQGAQDAAWQAGKVLVIVNTGSDASVEHKAIEAMLQRQVDGLVYATMYHELIEPPSALRDVPAVLLDCRSNDVTLSSVAPDEEGGAYSATLHLLDAGHRHIGYLQSDADIPAAAERLRGYQSALASRGIEFDPALVASGLDEFPGGVRAASALLDTPSRPTAIFCFNDRMAAGAAFAARRRGLSIPRDLSLVGYDNEELVALLTDPPLTTIQLPHYEMGRWAVIHLLEQIAGRGGTPQQYRMPCPLVVRKSVRAPAEDSPSGSRTRP